MIRGPKDEDPVISKFLDYLFTSQNEQWEVIDENVRWGVTDKNFDYLLRKKGSKELIEVEVTGLYELEKDGSPFKLDYSDHFEKNLKKPLLELAKKKGYGGDVTFQVFPEYIRMVKDCKPYKRAEALLEIIEKKSSRRSIIRTNRDSSGLPNAVLLFEDDIALEYGLIHRALKRIIEKKSEQFSDDRSNLKIILVDDKFPYKDVMEELKIEGKRLMEVEGFGPKVKTNQIFFYDRDPDKIEQVYPSSVKLVEEYIVVGEDEEGGWILEEKK